jgi:hypothetical protein
MSTSHPKAPNSSPGNGTDSEENQNESRRRRNRVFVRNDDDGDAMMRQRIKRQTKNVFRRMCCKDPKDPNRFKNKNGSKKKDDDAGSSHCNEDNDTPPTKQYRLEANHRVHQTGLLRRLAASCCCGSSLGSSKQSGTGIKSNQRLASLLHWMFRVNFVLLFAVMCGIFFVWVMIFAGFIIVAGAVDGECVRVGECILN